MRFDGKKDPERRKAIERGELAPLGALSGPEPFREYRKTSTTFAKRIDEPFEVDTLEGLHSGKAGDWLAVGQAGELYPIDAAVFAATYELVDE
jgi:hypothetical protein